MAVLLGIGVSFLSALTLLPMSATSTIPPTIVTGYRPGVLGRITELHGTYYHRHAGFGVFFEARVARGLADFLERYDDEHDGI